MSDTATMVPLTLVGYQPEEENAAETSIAKSIRKRRNKCSKDCGSEGGGCGTKTGEAAPPAEPEKEEHVLFVEVEFKGRRRGVFRNDKKVELGLGDIAVVEAERGIDGGTVCAVGKVAFDKIQAHYDGHVPLHQVIRKGTEADEQKLRENRRREEEARAKARERVKHFNLDMKLTDAEWQFDRNRITFFFTAPRQVDFRALVKDLAAIFSSRIELRQISPRDEARRTGGVGVCGLELCCTTFLRKFDYITLDHAKLQQLPTNPTKLSGLCGRLKCCLLYEVDMYTEALRNFPPLETELELPGGKAKIFKIDIFRDQITLSQQGRMDLFTLSLAEVKKVMKGEEIFRPDIFEQHAEQERKAQAAEDRAKIEESLKQEEGDQPKKKRKRRRKKKPSGNTQDGGAQATENKGGQPESNKPKERSNKPQSKRGPKPPRGKSEGKPNQPKAKQDSQTKQQGQSKQQPKAQDGEKPKQGGKPRRRRRPNNKGGNTGGGNSGNQTPAS